MKTDQGKKILVLVIAILGWIAIITGGILIALNLSPVRRLTKAFEAGKYKEMRELYPKIQKKERYEKRLQKHFSEEIREIAADYEEGKLDYDTAMAKLTALHSLEMDGLEDELSENMDEIRFDHEMSGCFEAAEDRYKKKFYLEAIEYYQKIGRNYEKYRTAQKRIEECATAYKDTLFGRIGTPGSAEEYDLAINELEEALLHLPEDQEIRDRIALYRQNSAALSEKILKDEAERMIAAGEYRELLDLIDAGLKESPEDDSLNKLRLSVFTAYEKEIFDKADRALADGSYPEAFRILKDAARYLPEDEGIGSRILMLKSEYINKARQEADALGREGEYTEAFKLLEEALKEFPGDEDLQQSLRTLTDRYIGERISALQNLADRGNYEKALDQLEDLIQAYPERSELLALQEEIAGMKEAAEKRAEEEKKTAEEKQKAIEEKIKKAEEAKKASGTKLTSLSGKIIDGGFQIIEKCRDIYGTTYTEALAGTESDYSHIMDYELNGQYQKLRGIIIRDDGVNIQQLVDPETDLITLSVYGDGKLLYKSISSNLPGGELQFMDVDVSGVKTLRLVIYGKLYIRLCNAVLQGKTADVKLTSLSGTVADGEIQVIGECSDIYGTVYKNALAGGISEYNNVIEYDLGGRYRTFSGVIIRDSTAYLPGLSNPNRDDIVVVVYGDGTSLYRSISSNLKGGEKQPFSINVSGVKKLRIVINGKNYIRICNAVLSAG